MTDEEIQELEDKLRPKLSEDFLTTLVEAAKIHGNTGDWVAVKDFVRAQFHLAGKEPPEMEPYE